MPDAQEKPKKPKRYAVMRNGKPVIVLNDPGAFDDCKRWIDKWRPGDDRYSVVEHNEK